MSENFHYDQQVRRFIIQLVRMFSEFTVQYGKANPGNDFTYVRVPVRYADSSRQAQTALMNNSENTMASCPIMALYISDMKYNRERVQDPTYVDRVNVRTRRFDEATKEFLPQQGNAYTLQRLMPVPYDLSIHLEIWTSNTTQKLQILEQILCLFNPAIEIQSSDNYFDWSSLSYVELTDVQWSSRSIPVGTADQIDVAKLTFKVPIWINAPAKVTVMNAIYKVIASIYTEDGEFANPSDWELGDDLVLATRQVVTFNNYNVFIENNNIQLLQSSQRVTANSNIDIGTVQGPSVQWANVISDYGNIRPGISQIRLSYDNTSNAIVGTITINPFDPTSLLYTPDPTTIPTNTLNAIDGLVNPQTVAPGNGLPPAAAGQYYLLIEPIGQAEDADYAQGWTFNNVATIAMANDIIVYNGTAWELYFIASANSEVQYVTNITTGHQYKWNGSAWVKSWEGEYNPANWQLVL